MFNQLKRFYFTSKLIFTPTKPAAFLTALKSYLHAKISDKPVIRGVDIVTNYSCNLLCKHCNIDNMVKNKNNQLTLDDYREIEKQCTNLGIFQYCFTGGEPLLCKDFEEIVKIFKPYKRIMLIQTNGRLITSFSKAKHLKDIGIDILNVSLDSGIAQEHDKNRGVKGHYFHTLKVIDWGKKAGMQIIIGTVVSHENLHSEGINKLINFVNKNNYILLLNLAVPAGKWYKNQNILLTKEDQAFVRELVKNNPALRLDMNSTINQYGCPAFKEKLYITPYGEVTGCTFAQISFGNVKDKSLKEIRNLALKTNLMNKYSQICYAAEDRNFINKYMSKLGNIVPQDYKKIMGKK